MITPARDPESLRAEGRSPASAAAEDPDRLEAAASSWRQEVDAIRAALMRSLDLQKRAVGLRLFDAAWRGVIAAMGIVVAIVMAACAALLLIEGARRGLATWSGDAWWSDLVIGGVLAAVVCSGLYSVQRIAHQTSRKQVQRKLSSPRRAEQGPA